MSVEQYTAKNYLLAQDTLLGLVCLKGDTKTLKLLLQNPQIDVNMKVRNQMQVHKLRL